MTKRTDWLCDEILRLNIYCIQHLGNSAAEETEMRTLLNELEIADEEIYGEICVEL